MPVGKRKRDDGCRYAVARENLISEKVGTARLVHLDIIGFLGHHRAVGTEFYGRSVDLRGDFILFEAVYVPYDFPGYSVARGYLRVERSRQRVVVGREDLVVVDETYSRLSGCTLQASGGNLDIDAGHAGARCKQTFVRQVPQKHRRRGYGLRIGRVVDEVGGARPALDSRVSVQSRQTPDSRGALEDRTRRRLDSRDAGEAYRILDEYYQFRGTDVG